MWRYSRKTYRISDVFSLGPRCLYVPGSRSSTKSGKETTKHVFLPQFRVLQLHCVPGTTQSVHLSVHLQLKMNTSRQVADADLKMGLFSHERH